MADKTVFETSTETFGTDRVTSDLTKTEARALILAERATESYSLMGKPKGLRRVTFSCCFEKTPSGVRRVRYVVVSKPALDEKQIQMSQKCGFGI